MTDYRDLADLLLAATEGAIGPPQSAVYLAGPLATGREFYVRSAEGTLDAEDLRARNTRRMAELAETLRQSTSRVVYDPGVLRVPQWTGRQHGDFFLEVIDRFCDQLLLIPGWEYSSGATKEFVHAQERGVPCHDLEGQLVTRAEGLRLIETAVATVVGLGQRAEGLERRVAALRS